MTTVQFIATLRETALVHGAEWALAEIAAWKDAEHAEPQPMTPDDWAALARADAQLRQGKELRE